MKNVFVDSIRCRPKGALHDRASARPHPGFAAWLFVMALVVTLSGCAVLPADNGRGNVDQLLMERGTPVDDNTAKLLTSLLAAPLTAESATRIALLNNPELHSTYASLGFGAADIDEAGRIRNPVLGASLLNSSRPAERDKLSFGLVASFTDLITLPARKRLAEGSFAALQQSVGAEVLRVAAETERAFYDYVGAQQVVALRAQIAKAGGLSALLAARYRDAGNLTLRELALERAAASQAELALIEAQDAAYAARTTLARLLGVSVAQEWTVPAQLPMPVAREDELEALLLLAGESRLDLASARARAALRADELGVVNWTRWLGELEIGFELEREAEGGSLRGPSLAWELPIFNQHEDAVLRADTQLQLAVNDVRRIATDVDNDVHLAHDKVVNARARIAQYRDVMIPQRIETVALAQREVNYMLLGVFELLALKQDEFHAYQGYIEAIRDYWLARADLGLATGTQLPSTAQIGGQGLDIDQLTKPPSPGMDHSGHKGHTSDGSAHTMSHEMNHGDSQ